LIHAQAPRCGAILFIIIIILFIPRFLPHSSGEEGKMWAGDEEEEEDEDEEEDSRIPVERESARERRHLA
jgi:hypothetical protein